MPNWICVASLMTARSFALMAAASWVKIQVGAPSRSKRKSYFFRKKLVDKHCRCCAWKPTMCLAQAMPQPSRHLMRRCFSTWRAEGSDRKKEKSYCWKDFCDNSLKFRIKVIYQDTMIL